jgi:site-specific DNA-methyltransferase (adenine-specific)
VKPYYEDDTVQLYLGDMREILPGLGLQADLVCTDPPYGETSLTWDRWVNGWPTIAATIARSLWCFGSMRMFLDRRDDFTTAGWKLSQDIVWEKHNGSGFQNDRFKRVHENALHWYRGDWRDQYREVPTTPDATPRTVRRKHRPPHMGEIGDGAYRSEDGGPRLMRSVLQVRSMHGRALHPTEKPLGILTPLIEYACPPGGLVVDPFAGSGSTLDAARQSGRRAVGMEADERYAEAAARRLSQLTFGGAA